MARRTDAKFNKLVLKRLHNSRVHRSPMSLSKLTTHFNKQSVQKDIKAGKDIVFAVVGTITDDVRQLELPAVKICALRFTETARRRITQNGGQCITFDQLAINRPKGENVVLLRGPRDREALRHFGPAPGVPGSHTK